MSRPLTGLLTGPVGAGKTTVAERVAGLVHERGLTCGGLLAPSLKDSSGTKIGIWGVDLHSGERRVLARIDRAMDGPHIGIYSFDATTLSWAIGAIERAMGSCDLLIVDEIGKLELWGNAGLAPLVPRLALGTVTRSLVIVREALLAELQTRLGPVKQAVFEVGRDNRDQLPPQIVARLFSDGKFDN